MSMIHTVKFTYEDFISDICASLRKVKIDFRGYQQDGETYLEEIKVTKLESFTMSDKDVVESFMDYLEQTEPRFIVNCKIEIS